MFWIRMWGTLRDLPRCVAGIAADDLPDGFDLHAKILDRAQRALRSLQDGLTEDEHIAVDWFRNHACHPRLDSFEVRATTGKLVEGRVVHSLGDRPVPLGELRASVERIQQEGDPAVVVARSSRALVSDLADAMLRYARTFGQNLHDVDGYKVGAFCGRG